MLSLLGFDRRRLGFVLLLMALMLLAALGVTTVALAAPDASLIPSALAHVRGPFAWMWG